MSDESVYIDPVEEVYRIREAIMDEFDWDVRKYNAYLTAHEYEMEEMGFKKAEPLAVREARKLAALEEAV